MHVKSVTMGQIQISSKHKTMSEFTSEVCTEIRTLYRYSIRMVC